jgi:hypothetical protein
MPDPLWKDSNHHRPTSNSRTGMFGTCRTKDLFYVQRIDVQDTACISQVTGVCSQLCFGCSLSVTYSHGRATQTMHHAETTRYFNVDNREHWYLSYIKTPQYTDPPDLDRSLPEAADGMGGVNGHTNKRISGIPIKFSSTHSAAFHLKLGLFSYPLVQGCENLSTSCSSGS